MAQDKKMTLHPLHDRVLLKRIDEEPARKSGIIIPDSAKEKPQEGKVIAVGKGKVSEDGKKTPLDVKAGDRVLYAKYAGTEVKGDDGDLLVLRASDILTIVEKSPARSKA